MSNILKFIPLSFIKNLYMIPWKKEGLLWLVDAKETERSEIGKRIVPVDYIDGLRSVLTFIGIFNFDIIDDVKVNEYVKKLEKDGKLIRRQIEKNERGEYSRLHTSKDPFSRTKVFYILFDTPKLTEKDVRKAIQDKAFQNPELLFPFLNQIIYEISIDDLSDDSKNIVSPVKNLLSLKESIKDGIEEKGIYIFFHNSPDQIPRRIIEIGSLLRDILTEVGLHFFTFHDSIPIPANSIFIKMSKEEEKKGNIKELIGDLLLKNLEKYIPRLLTSDEIEDIVNSFPNIRNFSEKSSNVATNSLKKTYKALLEQKYLTPLGLGALKREMIRQFEKSVVEAGTVVGSNAAESIGRPVSQTTFNTFHTSGTSKNLGSGLQNIERVLYLSTSEKNSVSDSTTIHFKNRTLTFDQILQKREEIVGIYVKDLLKGKVEFELFSQVPQYYWHNIYSYMTQRDLSQVTKVLRFHFDISKLITYKITLHDIAKLIENKQDALFCIVSPMRQGIIDIFEIEEVAHEQVKKIKKLENMADKSILTILFLTTIVQPIVEKILIKGIIGITSLFPARSPIIKIIENTKRYLSDKELKLIPDEKVKKEQANIWYVFLSEQRMIDSGISWENILNIFSVLNIGILRLSYSLKNKPSISVIKKLEEQEIDISESLSGKNYYIVSMPIETTEDPLQFIKKKMEEDDKNENEYEEDAKKKGIRTFRRPATPLSKVSYYYFGETNGINLRELFLRRDVNQTLTISNKFSEVLSVLGIESCRYVLIKQLYEVIAATGVNIDTRHIVLLIDFMINRGIPHSISYSGLGKQGKETIEMASFERSLETFAKTAVIGGNEQTKSISSAIFLGQIGKIGTGIVDVRIDKEYEKMNAIEMSDEKFDANEINSTFGDEFEDENPVQSSYANLTKYYSNVTEIHKATTLEHNIAASLQAYEEKSEHKNNSEGKMELNPPLIVPKEIQDIAKKVQTKITLKGLAPTLLKPLRPLTLTGTKGKEEVKK